MLAHLKRGIDRPKGLYMRRSLGQEIFKTSKAFLYHGATDISDVVFDDDDDDDDLMVIKNEMMMRKRIARPRLLLRSLLSLTVNFTWTLIHSWLNATWPAYAPSLKLHITAMDLQPPICMICEQYAQ